MIRGIMDETPSPAEAYYETFIQRVKETGEVWGLCRGEEEWAYSESDEFEDTEVLLFWSDKALALKLQQDEWRNHHATAIPVEEFVDKWLQGMHQDEIMVGPNWDADFVGLEVPAEEIARQLIDGDESDEEEETDD